MANWYDNGRKALGTASVNWGTTQIDVILVKSTYSQNTGTHVHINDITASEISATNYARKTLAYPGTPISADTTAHLARLFANALTWTALGGASNDTIGGLVLAIHTGTDSTATLLFFVPTNALTTAGNDVTFTPDATNGLATI